MGRLGCRRAPPRLVLLLVRYLSSVVVGPLQRRRPRVVPAAPGTTDRVHRALRRPPRRGLRCCPDGLLLTGGGDAIGVLGDPALSLRGGVAPRPARALDGVD